MFTGNSTSIEQSTSDPCGRESVEPTKREQHIHAAFVTSICPHYRVKTFETLTQLGNIQFFFCSVGNEWYWQRNHGISAGNFPYVYLRGYQLTRRLRIVPSLVTKLWRNDYDVFVKCINGRFALPVTYLIARLRRKPFVLWTGIWMTLDTPFHRLIFPVTRWIYQHADAIVVYGEHVKRYLMTLNVPAERIFVAHHAVDNLAYNKPVSLDKKRALRKALRLEEQKIVLYLGRLETIKGLQYLLQAFGRLKLNDAALVIAGEGSLRQELETQARRLGIDQRTRFAGYVRAEESPVYYALADVLVLPSVTMPTGKETWGLVVNEAMNQGVPVIATDAVGAAAGDLVQNGVNGFVVPERDSPALAQAMERILTDPELRERLSQNGRKIIAEWDNERMVKGFQQAIQYALQQSGAVQTGLTAPARD